MTTTVRRILLLAAFIFALIAAFLGFGWAADDWQDEYAGFLALAIALGLASRWA
jgi:hypothetical protein